VKEFKDLDIIFKEKVFTSLFESSDKHFVQHSYNKEPVYRANAAYDS